MADDTCFDFDMTCADVAYWAENREREVRYEKVKTPPKGTSPVPKYKRVEDLLMLDYTPERKLAQARDDATLDAMLSNPAELQAYLESLLDGEDDTPDLT